MNERVEEVVEKVLRRKHFPSLVLFMLPTSLRSNPFPRLLPLNIINFYVNIIEKMEREGRVNKEDEKLFPRKEGKSSCADKNMKRNFISSFITAAKVRWREADYERHVFNKLFHWLERFTHSHPRLSPAPFIRAKIINKQRASSWSGGHYDFISTPFPRLPLAHPSR